MGRGQKSRAGAQLSRGPGEEGPWGWVWKMGRGKKVWEQSRSRRGGGASVAGWQEALLKSLALAPEDSGYLPAYTEGQSNRNLKARGPFGAELSYDTAMRS